MAKHKILMDPHTFGSLPNAKVGDEVEVPDNEVAALAAIGLIEPARGWKPATAKEDK